MQTEFQDRLAVITGASSGIGLALCAALLPRGVKVLAMSRTVGELPALQQIYGERLQWCAGDVTCEEDLQGLARRAAATSAKRPSEMLPRPVSSWARNRSETRQRSDSSRRDMPRLSRRARTRAPTVVRREARDMV